MACIVFLLIVIFVHSEATSLQCSPSDTDGSGDTDDLQQVSELQYCIVDNCTIMRIDNGEKLDIIYTTKSIIAISSTGGQTSSVIPKNDNAQSCAMYNSIVYGEFIGLITIDILLMIMSTYILIVHLIFKELHNLMGKLMMIYNIFLVSQTIVIGILSVFVFLIPVN